MINDGHVTAIKWRKVPAPTSQPIGGRLDDEESMLKTVVATSYKCLPETIDPREPKVK